MRRQRRHLLIRAFNTRPAGASLRDQFGGCRGNSSSGLSRADVEAALKLEPGSARSDRLLRGIWEEQEGTAAGAVEREAFLAFLEQGTPLPPSPSPRPQPSLALALVPLPSPHTSPKAPRRAGPWLLPDSTNEDHPLRRHPHWRKRELVVEERLVEYTTASGGRGLVLIEWRR